MKRSTLFQSVFTLVTASFCLGSYGQTVEDVSLFNTNTLRGTPRYTAMGGAFTSLGGDFSAIHLNPAGQSVFKNNTAGLSLGFQNLEMESSFFDQNTIEEDFNVDVENFGLVFKFDVNAKNQDWKKLALGLSYQKKAEFNRSYTVSGFNDGLSLSEIWANRAEGLDSSGFLNEPAFAAFQSFLLVTDANGVVIEDGYAHALNPDNDILYNRQESGALNEFAVNFSGQYKTRFYYGFSLGFPTLNYRLEQNISETGFPTDSIPFDATGYSFFRDNRIDADGFNFSVGAIGRITDWWRLGASFQSPTWYTVTQLFEFDLSTQFANGDQFDSDIFSTGDYSYQLQTPAFYRVGTSFIFGELGLLSFDYSYQDATGNELSTNNNSFNIRASELSIFNEDIEAVFANAHSFNAGAEVNFKPFVVRAGYAYQQSPYANEQFFQGDITTYSGGLALRMAKFDIELAYSYATFDQDDVLFASDFGSLETNKTQNTRTNFIAGFNFRF